ETNGHIAGSRRQVEQQSIQIAPIDVAEHLDKRAVEHRPAPGHHLIFSWFEHADAHDLHRLGGVIAATRADVDRYRHNHVFDLGGTTFPEPEHVGNRMPVNIGVNQPDFKTASSH